jgi:hypothetical protein
LLVLLYAQSRYSDRLLAAHQQIQECLKYTKKAQLEKDDVTAILRLSQHLRVFGLLSAVGYLNHAKGGKVQDRTAPMWLSLLWQLVNEKKLPIGDKEQLMQTVQQMAEREPRLYMVMWRKALVFSNHWNFWAKAYQEEQTNDSAEHSTPSS